MEAKIILAFCLLFGSCWSAASIFLAKHNRVSGRAPKSLGKPCPQCFPGLDYYRLGHLPDLGDVAGQNDGESGLNIFANDEKKVPLLRLEPLMGRKCPPTAKTYIKAQ